MSRKGLINLDFAGAEFLEQALRDLGSDPDVRKALGDSMLQAAEPMAKAARAKVRRGKTLRLEESIDVSKTLSRRQRSQAHTRTGPTEATVYVGPKPVGAGVLLEFGTTLRHWRTGKSTGHVPAFPFMRPAFEETKFQVIDLFGKLLWINIEKAAKRIARRQTKASK